MKKKYLLLLPSLAFAMQGSALAQDVHPALKTAASKIDTSAEHFALNKLSGDIGALTQYLDVILDTARKNGEKIPASLKAADLMQALGINHIKAYGHSSTKIDNAWVNRSYTDTGGSDKGVFSIFGKKNQAYAVPSMCPAGTDLALQLQLDLRQAEEIANSIATSAGEGDKCKAAMSKEVPNLGMTVSQLLAKMNIRLNIAMDLDDTNTLPTPFGKVGRPLLTVRIDGITWLWSKLGDQMIAQSEMPFEKSEKDGLIIYKLPAEALAEQGGAKEQAITQMFGLSPVLIIDKAKDQIWITSNEEFLSKCMSGENTLADSSEFKAAMEGLPAKGNSMAYVSKHMLNEVAQKYARLADSGLLGEDFDKAKTLVDRLMEDITESDKGWAASLSKDDQGVGFYSRGPFAIKHLEYVSGILPYLMASSNGGMDIDIKAGRP